MGNGLTGRKGVAVFDERRNTSRVFGVPREAFTEARAACEAWMRANPEHARWLLDGHPTLTDAEHRRRFGCDYDRAKPRRQSGR